jgi:hypothetical protein
MDIEFKGTISHDMMIYLDDVTIYSKKRDDHPQHLKQNFERCKKYSISPNHKKRNFVVSEGKILGHSISKDEISIDLNEPNTLFISHHPPPHTKKSMQSFFGRINLVRRFVLDISKISKPPQ